MDSTLLFMGKTKYILAYLKFAILCQKQYHSFFVTAFIQNWCGLLKSSIKQLLCITDAGDVPWHTSYGVYISQRIRFARASSNLSDFNCRNKALTAKLLKQGYRYFKFRKAFSKFYRRHNALVEKYNVSLKTLLQKGISEPEFYGDLVYRFKKLRENLTFRSKSGNELTVIKESVIAWISCGRVHA